MTERVSEAAPTGNYFRDTRPDEPDEPRVLYRVEQHIAHVVINRPLVLNAIHADVHHGIVDGMRQADADDEVRVVILSGKGRAFSVGGDRGMTPEERAAMRPAKSIDTGLAIWNCRKPVIAAVQGYALGQGAEIAAICDMTIAADDARFGEVQINMGSGPPILSAPSVMGIKQVKEYLLTGDHFTAQRALEVGLVNRVVPRDRLMDEALVLARRLALAAAQDRAGRQEADQRRLRAGRLHRLAHGGVVGLRPIGTRLCRRQELDGGGFLPRSGDCPCGPSGHSRCVPVGRCPTGAL